MSKENLQVVITKEWDNINGIITAAGNHTGQENGAQTPGSAA